MQACLRDDQARGANQSLAQKRPTDSTGSQSKVDLALTGLHLVFVGPSMSRFLGSRGMLWDSGRS